MALSIKTETADRLARELAAVTGESLTEAVTESLRERLARVRRHPDLRVAIQRLQDEYASEQHVNNDLTDDEIVGYDEFGAPA